jgi:hypothetical protein
MATRAYVFVYATAGKTEEVAKAIAQLEGVKSSYPCWGRPDVIAFRGSDLQRPRAARSPADPGGAGRRGHRHATPG